MQLLPCTRAVWLSNDRLPHEPGIHPALIKLACQRGQPAACSAGSSLTWGERAWAPWTQTTGAGTLPGTWELGQCPGPRSQVDGLTFIVPILLEKSHLSPLPKRSRHGGLAAPRVPRSWDHHVALSAGAQGRKRPRPGPRAGGGAELIAWPPSTRAP